MNVEREGKARSETREIVISTFLSIFGMTLGFALLIAAVHLDYGLSANRALFKHAMPLGVFGGALCAVLTYLGRKFPSLSYFTGFSQGLLLAPYALALIVSAFTLDSTSFIAIALLILVAGMSCYRLRATKRLPSGTDWLKCLLLVAAIHPVMRLARYLLVIPMLASTIAMTMSMPVLIAFNIAVIAIEWILLSFLIRHFAKVVKLIDSLPTLAKAILGGYCGLWIVTVIWGIPEVRKTFESHSTTISFSSPFPFYVSVANSPDCWWEKENIRGGYYWFFGYQSGSVASTVSCSEILE